MNLTKQEVFDKVWNHFIVNNGPPSIGADGRCKYRGPNEERCAAGLFIEDESCIVEGAAASTLSIFGNDIKFRFFMDSIQACHDKSVFPGLSLSPEITTFKEEIQKRLVRLAENNNLVIPGDEK